MIPIQVNPNSYLHRLRKRYGKNRRDHIQALESAIIQVERERDAALYQLERQQKRLSVIALRLEHLQ